MAWMEAVSLREREAGLFRHHRRVWTCGHFGLQRHSMRDVEVKVVGGDNDEKRQQYEKYGHITLPARCGDGLCEHRLPLGQVHADDAFGEFDRCVVAIS